MKLHWSPRSPFVRKVMIVAHELGITERITRVRTAVATTRPNSELMRENPLSKIPTLVLADDTVIFDSPVICEYLDRSYGPRLIPARFPDRISALRRQALGDGFLDVLLWWRNERQRPAELRSELHLASYAEKRRAALSTLEREASDLQATTFSIGHVAIGCALSYLDFRFAAEDWRNAHPRIAAWHATFSDRASVRATEPADDI
jgi:glutathione S-transferase